MKYPGQELENFDKATVWRKYVYFEIKKFIIGNTLEVGAGIGSFTNNYKHLVKNLTLSELDEKNFQYIKKKFESENIKITNSLTENINESFDTIMYLNVLEHIKDDIEEINQAFKKLNKNGHLIILVPAHNKLYSKFDKEIGHHKRYEMKFFKNINISNSEISKIIYLDATGYFLYYLNKIFFKEEVYPSKLKIFLWDKFFTPITFFLDKILLNRVGKNIIYILKRL